MFETMQHDGPWEALDRRQALRLCAGAAAALAAGPAALSRALAQQQESPFTWSKLSDRAQVAMGGGGNALVYTVNGKSHLIDCKNLGLGHTLLTEAQAHGGTLVGVFNSHHHGDHVGGNNAFYGIFPVLAHPNAIERIKSQAPRYAQIWNERFRPEGAGETSPDAWVPTRRLRDEHEFLVGGQGGRIMRAVHVGPGHTDNDVFFHFPDDNLLHTGDLVFHKLHPFLDASAGGRSAGWIRSLEAMLELCDDQTVVVPGHGEITDKSGIEQQREYFLVVREEIRKNIDAGKPREEAIRINPPIFEGMGFERIRDRTLGMIYDELVAEAAG